MTAPSDSASPGAEVSADTGAQDASPYQAVIGSLAITTIGSTVDPTNGDQNPYGLAIAPVTMGLLTAGDLVHLQLQRRGQRARQRHDHRDPAPGPRLHADPHGAGPQPEGLRGARRRASTTLPGRRRTPRTSLPTTRPSGTLVSTLVGRTVGGPWGEIFAPAFGARRGLVRDLQRHERDHRARQRGRHHVHDHRHAASRSTRAPCPGNILGRVRAHLRREHTTRSSSSTPTHNRVVAFAGYSTLGANAIVVEADGSFSGPSAASAQRALLRGAAERAHQRRPALQRRPRRRQHGRQPPRRDLAGRQGRGDAEPRHRRGGGALRHRRHRHRRERAPRSTSTTTTTTR